MRIFGHKVCKIKPIGRYICDRVDGGEISKNMVKVPPTWTALQSSQIERLSKYKLLNHTDREICLKQAPDPRERIPAIRNPVTGKQQLVKARYYKPYESTYECNRPIQGGGKRALDMLKPRKYRKTTYYKEDFDAEYDVCIIGGGVIGCSIAYFLASKYYEGMKICVVEKDPTYRNCATTLSVGGLRQQFSIPENVHLSLYGADFIRQADRLLYTEGMDSPPMNFQPHGYLFLASEDGADIMEQNHHVQIECGARVELLSPERLKRKFPWVNTDGIALASYGYENEGWFDPWALMTALRIKASDLGVTFIQGEVYNIAHELNKISDSDSSNEVEDLEESARLINRPVEAHIHLADGDVWPLKASIFVIAAGAESGHIAHLAGIGSGKDLLKIPCPVEPRKRYVYCVHSHKGPGLDCPLVVDPSGAYLRREGLGGLYICGRSPPNDLEPAIDDLHVDYDYFDAHVWPKIAARVPSFNNCKVKSAWAGFYDYNYWDQNAIVGQHDMHSNVYFATGFSGHGIQQAPAIGRAIAELIIDGDYQSIDLSRFDFSRILHDIREREVNIV